MSTRAIARGKINNLFVLDPDLDAFIMDHFDDVWRSISRGMSRTEKINQLLSMKDPAEIEASLLSSDAQPSTTLPGQSEPSTLDTSPLRREISRLQHVIRDLEQQLSGQNKWESTIDARDGLDRIQKCARDMDELIEKLPTIDEQRWMTVGHNTLDVMESSLGRFHNISCEFRFRFLHEKQPFPSSYRALLTAASNILTQQVEEDDRRAKSWAQTTARLNSGSRGGGFFR